MIFVKRVSNSEVFWSTQTVTRNELMFARFGHLLTSLSLSPSMLCTYHCIHWRYPRSNQLCSLSIFCPLFLLHKSCKLFGHPPHYYFLPLFQSTSLTSIANGLAVLLSALLLHSLNHSIFIATSFFSNLRQNSEILPFKLQHGQAWYFTALLQHFRAQSVSPLPRRLNLLLSSFNDCKIQALQQNSINRQQAASNIASKKKTKSYYTFSLRRYLKMGSDCSTIHLWLNESAFNTNGI